MDAACVYQDHKKKLIPESAINSTLAFLLPDMAGPDGMQDLQRCWLCPCIRRTLLQTLSLAPFSTLVFE
jgi:hypothetical protein